MLALPQCRRHVVLLFFVTCYVLVGVLGEEDAGCPVNYEDPQPTCSDAAGSKSMHAGMKDNTPGETGTRAKRCVVEDGVDYPGDWVDGDIDAKTNVASVAACCDLCKATKHCRYWTFSTPERGQQPNYCWLKNKHVKAYRTTQGGAGLVSGYVTKKQATNSANEGATEQTMAAGGAKTQSGSTNTKPASQKAPGKESSAVKEESNSVKGPSQKKIAKAKALVEKAARLYQQGKGKEAEPVLRKAIEKDSTNGSARMWLGFVLETQGRWQAAMSEYESALAPGRIELLRDEDLAMTHNNLGLLYYKKQQRHDDAEAQFLKANAASERAGMKEWTHSHKNLARLLEKNGRAREAMALLDVVAERRGDDALAFYSTLLLPYVYQDQQDIAGWRTSFKKNLVALAKRGIAIRDPFSMEGVPQYYLSYHGRNDAVINTDIARLFRAACQVCAFTAPHTVSYSPKGKSAKVHVGFVSYYFRDHSVSKMALGVLKGLDRTNFHTVLFHFGFKDGVTDRLASYVDTLRLLENAPLAQVKDILAKEALDVLVFAEIGMDPHSYALAFGRYAPIQIVMHGHAQTSGVSSLDYYVSYRGFSEPQAQSHYSEQLLVVDGYTPLPRYYEEVAYSLSPHMATEAGQRVFKGRFGIPQDATVYACLQTLFKVDPRMDEVAARILRGHPGSVVLFKELPMTNQVGKQVIARMRKTLSAEELARVVFLPPLSDQDYRDAYLVVDVLLDSFPFGGHTTSMDAFSAGCPVVSMPTDLMSGRCTQGFLKFMGLQELVVDTIDQLVDTCLKIGKDPALRSKLSQQIKDRLPDLIRDDTSTREWAQLLLAAGREGSEGLRRWESKSGERKARGG